MRSAGLPGMWRSTTLLSDLLGKQSTQNQVELANHKHKHHIYIYIYIYIYIADNQAQTQRKRGTERQEKQHRDTETQRHKDTETQRETPRAKAQQSPSFPHTISVLLRTRAGCALSLPLVNECHHTRSEFIQLSQKLWLRSVGETRQGTRGPTQWLVPFGLESEKAMLAQGTLKGDRKHQQFGGSPLLRHTNMMMAEKASPTRHRQVGQEHFRSSQ